MSKGIFAGKKVLVLGLAKSGEAAAKVLLKHGAEVTINDSSPLEGYDQAKKMQELGIHVVCGHHPIELLDESFSFIVKNPGIPYSNPLVKEAIQRKIPVFTEIELAYLLSKADMIAITGSNGKTTTTTLIYEMLRESNKQPLIAGNIGTVACEVADNATEDQVMVVEVSSFQLLGTQTFKPKLSVLLNLFDAHLDYHGTKEEYVKAKAKITQNQEKDDILIYNFDDPLVVQVAANSKATCIPFSTKTELDTGLYVKNNTIYFDNRKIIHTKNIVLPGEHNLENILAAVGAALTMGAEEAWIVQVLETFSGVPHRLQYVANYNGRRFFNDSKATNILATEKALQSFSEPLVLLAGGLDRGNGFDELLPYMKNVRALIAFGETKDKWAQVANEAGVKSVHYAEWIEEAVQIAYEQSYSGDVILLSPACASWDQYKTFEERGERFVKAVEMMKEK